MQYNSSKVLPLGFSDLTQDEAMLISIFRSWYEQFSNRAVFEQDIRTLLREDKIYPALGSLFAFFHGFVHLRLVHINKHEVLSPTEEYLIAILAHSGNYPDTNNLAQQCRNHLQLLLIDLRPVHTITRSGYDFLQTKVAQSYQRFMKSLL